MPVSYLQIESITLCPQPRARAQNKHAGQYICPHSGENLAILQADAHVAPDRLREVPHYRPQDARRRCAAPVQKHPCREQDGLGGGKYPEKGALVVLVVIIGRRVLHVRQGRGVALRLGAGKGGEESEVEAQAEGDEGVDDPPGCVVGGRRGGGGGCLWCLLSRHGGHSGEGRGAGLAHHLGHHLHEGVVVHVGHAAGRRGPGGVGVGRPVEAEHHLAELGLRDGCFGAGGGGCGRRAGCRLRCVKVLRDVDFVGVTVGLGFRWGGGFVCCGGCSLVVICCRFS